MQNACAGFFAAFFSSLTLCPTELIKCKLQAIREVQMETNSSLSVVKVVMTKKKNEWYMKFMELKKKK